MAHQNKKSCQETWDTRGHIKVCPQIALAIGVLTGVVPLLGAIAVPLLGAMVGCHCWAQLLAAMVGCHYWVSW